MNTPMRSIFTLALRLLSPPLSALPFATPLPASTAREMAFIKDRFPADIQLFWTKQLGRLRNLVRDSPTIGKARYGETPAEIRPSTGKIKIAALSPLMHQLCLGGGKWITQLTRGFNITGILPRREACPRDTKVRKGEILAAERTPRSSELQFAGRFSNAGRKNAAALRGDAMGKCEKGRLRGCPLSEPMRAPFYLGAGENVAFRFRRNRAISLVRATTFNAHRSTSRVRWLPLSCFPQGAKWRNFVVLLIPPATIGNSL